MKHYAAPLFMLMCMMLGTGLATAQDTLRTLTVSGEGVVMVQPDQAVVRFGVVTRDRNPEEAHRLNQTAAADAMNAVRALGIDDRKIRLETLRIEPDRKYNQDTRMYEEIGFMATREVSVTVDDLDRLPALISRVVQRGVNRLTGVSYDLSDKESVRRDALRRAAENAREKAQLLAETLGASLGRVITINEQGVYVPAPQIMLNRAAGMEVAMDQAAPDPAAYAAGEMEIRANVSLVYGLK